MKIVAFSTNSFTDDTGFMVDDEDYEKVYQFKWCLSKKHTGNQAPLYYVRRSARKEEKEDGAPNSILLHRFILGLHLENRANNRNEIDHINGNTLDNTKSNLRIVDKSVNQRNKRNNSKIGQGLWGATFNKSKKTNPWQANFHIKGKTYMVGYFDSEEEAHKNAVKKFEEIKGV